MAETIMNSDINSNDGIWGDADTIEYKDDNISHIMNDLEMAVSYFDEVETQIGDLENYDNQWKGKAKDTYTDLKTILTQYCGDYRTSVENLQTSVTGLNKLINSISSANVIKEIDEA